MERYKITNHRNITFTGDKIMQGDVEIGHFNGAHCPIFNEEWEDSECQEFFNLSYRNREIAQYETMRILNAMDCWLRLE